MTMAEINVSRLLLLALAMAAATLLAGPSTPAGAFEVCGQDVTKLINECKNYVKKEGPKVQPSKACCGEVQKLDVVCVCKRVPPGADQYVSLEKVVYVARSCGKKVPRGIKCGNYIVPLARHGGRD